MIKRLKRDMFLNFGEPPARGRQAARIDALIASTPNDDAGPPGVEVKNGAGARGRRP
jgi:hypothetical protein